MEQRKERFQQEVVTIHYNIYPAPGHVCIIAMATTLHLEDNTTRMRARLWNERVPRLSRAQV